MLGCLLRLWSESKVCALRVGSSDLSDCFRCVAFLVMSQACGLVVCLLLLCTYFMSTHRCLHMYSSSISSVIVSQHTRDRVPKANAVLILGGEGYVHNCA